jgi:hypothetical protein
MFIGAVKEKVTMIERIKSGLTRRSVAVVRSLDAEMPLILLIWVAVATIVCVMLIGLPDAPANAVHWSVALPYLLVVGGPVLALLLALRLFRSGALYTQPEIRLSRYGRWAQLDCIKVRRLPKFGAGGLMAALLLGILLNVPVRTFEFLVAMPALDNAASISLRIAVYAMTANVVITSSLYAVAFVMALRLVPLFPRFLVIVWGLDLLAQLGIGQFVASVPQMSDTMRGALSQMLEGNIHKAGLGIALWLPYLIMSDRVNLTYRNRVRI